MVTVESLTDEQVTALRITKNLHEALLKEVRDSLKAWESEGVPLEDAMSATLTAVSLAMGDTMFASINFRSEPEKALEKLAGITSHRAKEWAQLRLSGKDADDTLN